MTLKVMLAPGRYVQGPGALDHMGEQLEILGLRNPLILVSPSAKKAVGAAITRSLEARGLAHAFVDFGGECTRVEIERIKNVCIQGGHDAIINCGGGKVLDAGRAAATRSALNVEMVPPEHIPDLGAGVACINVPTVAASDASTSSVSLVYTDDHVVEATMLFPSSPAMVFVDTTVIAASPVRLLVAGMGDALATYFEADMCLRTGSPAVVTRSHSTRAAQALARLCFDLLMTYGVQAKREADAGVAGPGLEAVVEANILLSGLGFESGGISGSHAVGHGFYHVAEFFASPRYHGEVVAYGTLTQLMLEGRPPEFLKTVFDFCRAVGLPTTLEELTLTDTSDEVIERVALAAARDVVLISSMAGASSQPDELGRYYDHRVIFNAIKAVDVFGREYGA
ncbi:MAG: glycerol dehydrogenase [Actinobacteria bacterium]|nr:glycerol dehydrogenase [Actinomycetota bacterium]